MGVLVLSFPVIIIDEILKFVSVSLWTYSILDIAPWSDHALLSVG